MTVLQINMVHFGSTGTIMRGIAESVANEYETMCVTPKYYQRGGTEFPVIPNHKYFGSQIENFFHIVLSRLSGFHGCFSIFGTRQLIKMLDEIKPDVIHLHNLHNWTVNIPMLFNYIKKNHISTVWTLHDCWAFTGQCPHFTLAKCDKWKTCCHDCPQINTYPRAYVDRTKTMWKLKKKWFTGIENMTIVTPSRWLADLVKQSYLKDYPVQVINNGIDLSVFRPVKSNFREKYGIGDRLIVLGVAFGWGKRKGLDVFTELSKRLPESYQIVIVGTSEADDSQLPENIISIHRTNNQQELAEIYSAADVFANPTREENYPTVNMEALACGTPVITFDTGGSPEIIDESCGIAVLCDDADAMEKAIRETCEKKLFPEEACLKRAESFDSKARFQEYVDLYRRMAGEK